MFWTWTQSEWWISFKLNEAVNAQTRSCAVVCTGNVLIFWLLCRLSSKSTAMLLDWMLFFIFSCDRDHLRRFVFLMCNPYCKLHLTCIQLLPIAITSQWGLHDTCYCCVRLLESVLCVHLYILLFAILWLWYCPTHLALHMISCVCWSTLRSANLFIIWFLRNDLAPKWVSQLRNRSVHVWNSSFRGCRIYFQWLFD